MGRKEEIIQEMLEMQKKFIEIEKAGDFSAEQYYDTEGDGDLSVYKRAYDALATELVDLAHAEKGSHR